MKIMKIGEFENILIKSGINADEFSEMLQYKLLKRTHIDCKIDLAVVAIVNRYGDIVEEWNMRRHIWTEFVKKWKNK